MPGGVPDALHTLSPFIFKAAFQSNHQYPHFTHLEGETQGCTSNLCKVLAITGEQLKVQTPGGCSVVWRGCGFSRALLRWNRKVMNLMRSSGLS